MKIRSHLPNQQQRYYFSELIGIIIGDGNICYLRDHRNYYVEITGNPSKEKEYFTYVSYLFKQVMEKSGTISVRRRGLRLRVYSKEFVEFLINDIGLHFGEGKFKRITIPEKIIQSCFKESFFCLRGIFDTDGSFFIANKNGKKYPCIEISTCSKGLAKQIKELLNHKFRVRMRQEKNEKYTTGSRFVIALYGVKEVKKWFNAIGSSNPHTH